MKAFDCASVDEQDLVALYLAGKLAGPAAEAFEGHFLGCDRCAAELDQAGALRSAFGKPALGPGVVSNPRAGLRRELWTLLAAAAAVAMIGLGLHQLTIAPPVIVESPVFRSESADSLELRQAPGADGQVLLEWAPHPDALTYRVSVIRADGVPVLKTETPDSRIALNVGALPPLPAGVSFLAKVEAIDAMGRVVGSSLPESLPVH